MPDHPASTSVSPLKQSGASRVHLPWDSRFNAATLAQHLAEYPSLSFWNPISGEYAVGGYWRQRRDIGLVVEISSGSSRGPLVDSLLEGFRQRGLAFAVLSQDEADSASAWYREHGWAVADRLFVYRLAMSHLDLTRHRPIPVTPFEPGDLDDLIDLDSQAFPWLWKSEPSDFLAYSASPRVAVLLARKGDRLLGYASYTTGRGRGHLDRLAVDPVLTRRGYGAALLEIALMKMRSDGIHEVALTTQHANHSAQALYRKHGFTKTGEVLEILGMKLNDD
ncbi:MAG: GNAT family N-acetyltransferase [Dehalococcoidia bacterium]|nr:GNAT family N-acetyltransferase [Dehalococcoidia bacterium]